jgi:hypothetical protein
MPRNQRTTNSAAQAERQQHRDHHGEQPPGSHPGLVQAVGAGQADHDSGRNQPVVADYEVIPERAEGAEL